MTTRRLRPVAVLLAAVLAMGAEVARAEAAKIAVPTSITISTSTDFVVITGVDQGTRTFTGTCMQNQGYSADQPLRQAIVVDSEAGPVLLVVAALQRELKPGTRLANLSLVASCSDGGTTFNVYEGIIFAPQSSEVALIITPAGVTLTADHEGVVGAATDESGIADAVCVKQGSPTIKTAILSDIPLEAGDRLTGFVELDYDPETGETLYGCWVEY